MTDVFTLDGISLLDRTKYSIQSIGALVPNREVERSTRDCGSGAGGGISVSRDRITFWTLPIIVFCIPTGGSYQAAIDNANALINAIKAAIAFETKDTGSAFWAGSAVFVVLNLHDQTTPTVWTVKGGVYPPDRWELRGIKDIVLNLAIDMVEGAEFVDGSGLPINGASPGPFAMSSMVIVYSGTGTAKMLGGETLSMTTFSIVEP